MKAVTACLMRGGTSKGLYFLAKDLPLDVHRRNAFLLSVMGSPDSRQIDGVGGGHPLTSKVAVVSPSSNPEADVDYLFLQVAVDKAQVSDTQNCGNILAGVGAFAIEQGLVKAQDTTTDVRIRMVNTNTFAVVRVQTPNGVVNYEGSASIDGVPNTAAPVYIDFLDVAGSSCGSLFPTGAAQNTVEEINITCIDNGMPVVLIDAHSLGLKGSETPEQLESNAALKQKVEAIRLKAGEMMQLGDVTAKTIPKMTIISAPLNGGDINTRTFIPHRVHDAIGVLGSVSVATACLAKGTVAYDLYRRHCAKRDNELQSAVPLAIEHPTGAFKVDMEVANADAFETFEVKRAALLRTARLLMQGTVFAPDSDPTLAHE